MKKLIIAIALLLATSVPAQALNRGTAIETPLPAASGGTGGTTGTVPADGAVYNPGSNKLTKWKAAYESVVSGADNAIVLMIGSSTAAGWHSGGNGIDNPKFNLEGTIARNLSQVYGINADNDSIFGYVAEQKYTTDTRVSYGAGWGADSIVSIGGPLLINTTTTNPVAYTAPTTADRAVLYYVTDSAASLGTCSYDVNGGTATNINEGAASAALATVTVTLTPGANTINWKRVSGTCKFVGVRFYLSTKKTATIVNSGIGGTVAAYWQDVNGKPYSSPAVFASLSPALTYVIMNGNDAAAGTDDTAYKASMQAIYDAVSSTSDVIWVGQFQSSAATTAQWDAKRADLRALSLTNSNPLIDLYVRMPSYSELNANGLGNNDALHLSTLGYANVGNFLAGQTMTLAGQSPFDYSSGNEVQGLGTFVGLHTYTEIGDKPVDNSFPLTFDLSRATVSGIKGSVVFRDLTTGYAAGIGPALLAQYNDGSLANRTGGGIRWEKDNSTQGNYATSMYLSTRANGSAVADAIKVDGSKNLTVYGSSITLSTLTTPGATDACTAGTIWVDVGYIYVCTASGTVKRSALSGF